MNIYLLVEGRRTEKKVYPRWLGHLLPELTEVDDAFKVTKNNYYVFNGNGYPSLLDNHLKNAITDVNNINKFNYLAICLDSDDETVLDKKNEVLDFISNNNIKLINCSLAIIVQNKCIETWFLGNKRVYSRQPLSQELRRYTSFYNVQENDPELMGSIDETTCAQFHEVYLSEMLREKNIRYTKKNPNGVIEKYYLIEIIKRQTETNHLLSFKDFLDFCTSIKKGFL